MQRVMYGAIGQTINKWLVQTVVFPDIYNWHGILEFKH